MPYDPTLPANNSPLSSAQMRAQLQGLKSLIDAVPAGADGRSIVDVHDSGDGTGRAMVRMSDDTVYGPFIVGSGPAGPQGNNGADSTVPGPQGPEGRHVVNVRDSGDGRAIVDMSDGSSFGPFSVASGPQGIQGDRGSDGGPGPAGANGADGRSIVNVRDSGDGRAMVDMSDGVTYGPFTVAGGPPGPQGGQGEKGDKGDPGEVTSQQLSDAINNAMAGTSANSNSIQLLGLTVSDPPTQSELQVVADKLDELIAALRR